ncbi:MAG: site-2 protease family protein [Bacteroidales bacterium]|nr:site-2 protease family protein [Bacteroidales bacterium]
MDPHAQPDDNRPVNPAKLPPAHPNAPHPAPQPETLGSWFQQNWSKLAIMIASFAVICRYLHPFDVLLAGFGLSLIIFLHELGHFLAAKWCDVHVRTFSIGFGPALPFCQFRYGETTYKVAMIPLGGYVAMAGESEEDGEPEIDHDEEDNDPRSFRNKSVGQRMLIISAGVIMNLILGCACFVATYMNGVQEKPAVASMVEPGSAAWTAGIASGSEITRIDGRNKPWFDDLRPIVSSTNAGETVSIGAFWANPPGQPTRPEGTLFPVLGIAPPRQLQLQRARRNDDTPPYSIGSAAAEAKTTTGEPGFRSGDTLLAMTDTADPTKVTPFQPDLDGLPGAYFDFHRRMTQLAGQPVTIQVRRASHAAQAEGEPVSIVVPPAFRMSMGMRMRMGPVTAIRTSSSAAKVILLGDRIVEVECAEPSGEVTRFVAGQAPTNPGEKVTIKPLDPLRLPDELNWWSDRWLKNRSAADWAEKDRKIRVKVLRQGATDHTEKLVPVEELTWEPQYRYETTDPSVPGAPVPLSGLGIGYQVDHVVDAVEPGSPAAEAGIQPNDQFTEVRILARGPKDEDLSGKFEEIQPHQWGYIDTLIQRSYPHTIEAKLKRNGQPVEVKLAAIADLNWPIVERGLFLSYETRTQKADSVLEALEMGAYRTLRSIKMVYLGLYSMVFGRISYKLVSGPITLARASYFIAGEDVWHLLLWIGLISVNLAVVNFLPIPVLDGGHMVFLIYEWVRGKPAPIAVQAILTYAGLALIGSLMLFVIGLDLWRLFFA